jgi:predicted AAA+ superfamily ATPase
MERKITEEFLKWKRDSITKPFCLYGARQVGKTYSSIEFGRKYYKNIAYFDTYNNSELHDIMMQEKVVDRLITKLSLLASETIFKDDTLIIFDNVTDMNYLKALKIFCYPDNQYHVIAITNNRDEMVKSRVEDIYYRPMFEMDFEEFLINSDKKQLIDFIKDSYDTGKPMPFHQMAIDAYNDYLITGGFPEVVNAYLESNDELLIEGIKKKIIDIYEIEYAKLDLDSFNRSLEILSSIPEQLKKDNKKFQYGVIKKGGRSKEYDDVINLLASNNIVSRSYRITDVKSPLVTNKDSDCFKVYYNDVGLLYTLLHMNRAKLMNNDDLRRILIENNVANMISNWGYSLYYYQSEGKAEVSFVIQNRNGKIIPIEVVNKRLTKAKSLSLLLSKFDINDSYRITEENFGKKKNVYSVPVYAIFCLNLR